MTHYSKELKQNLISHKAPPILKNANCGHPFVDVNKINNANCGHPFVDVNKINKLK